jgi:hypothetical protein
VSCDRLPETGLGAQVGLLLLLAVACLVAGTTLALLARRSRGGPAVMVVVLLLGAVTTISTLGMARPAQAAGPGCSSSSPASSSAPISSAPPSIPTSSSPSVGRLIVTETSTTVGLAPGVAPAPITGRVVNHSSESTRITAVDVQIASITRSSASSGSACGISDYQLIAARMPVGRTLGPGGATDFAGASIKFNNKTINQNGCKGAIVHLLYTANPG